MRNFVVTIDGKQYQVGVEEVGVSENAVAPIVSEVKKTVAPAVTAQTAAPAHKTAVSANATKVNAPMPGLIKALSVAEGSQVKKGDVILVLEAMKMDNDITAPCDGVISYKTTKGTNVDTGALMAVIG